MAGSDLEARLAHVARTCVALRWELSSILGDGDRLPVDLVMALQLLDGKAELSGLGLRRHLGAKADMLSAAEDRPDLAVTALPTLAGVVDRISSL